MCKFPSFEMANFYAEIKNLINDCDISFIEPLSYMKHFSTAQNASASGASEKVVLLYKKVLYSFDLSYFYTNKIFVDLF